MKIGVQYPTVGSRFHYGNFSLGLLVDNHPRFTCIIVALVFFEVVFSWGEATP